MLRYLHLQNFRRHADTEIHFDDADQLIMVGGRNGHGKSSLLEAVQYCLYGETRHGNSRNIKRLVRRGAEVEGMQVTVGFDVDGIDYRVVRRLDGKTTAVLYANEIPIVEGPREVSAEVSRIFGMDARGFRLAVVANQKELDGLAQKRPAERAKELTRLLRLDAVTSAKDEARGKYRAATDVAQGLADRDGDTVDAAKAGVEDARSELAAVTAAAKDAQDRLAELDTALDETAAVDAEYQQALTDVARGEERVAAARRDVERIAGELAGLHVPDELDAGDVPVDELHRTSADLERRIAVAEAAASAAEQRRMLAGEIDTINARLDVISGELAGDSPESVQAEQVLADDAVTTAKAASDQAGERREVLLGEHAQVTARLEDAKARRAGADELGAACDACGQAISDEHRHAQHDRLDTAVAALEAELAEIVEDGKTVTAEAAAAKSALAEAQERLSNLAGRVRLVQDRTVERDELTRRRDVYLGQLDRLPDEQVDVDSLYGERARLAVAIDAATQAAEVTRQRAELLGRKSSLQDARQEAADRLTGATAELEAARPGAELVDAHAQRAGQVAARVAEAEVVTTLEREVAVAAERMTAARERLVRAERLAERRAKHQRDAMVSSACAELLADVADQLAGRIQPALQGTISELLGRLSDGRFTQAKVDGRYNISVADDDGKFRPLSEFSGGEADLIALAVRLSLASVVSDRGGSAGPGFLVLDEVFGSQDAGRRESILTALRNLRSAYGQILLTSHVGGLDGAADRVLDVTLGEPDETGLAVATVSEAVAGAVD